MKLVINTQYMENYGAHDWTGEGECPNHWKCKGGSTYVVEDLEESHIVKINMDGIPTLTNLLEHGSNYSTEHIIGYEIVEDDVDVYEEWETQYILSYQQDGEGPFGKWVCREISNIEYSNVVDKKIASYDLLDGGERANYVCEYRSVKDGFWYTESELREVA